MSKSLREKTEELQRFDFSPHQLDMIPTNQGDYFSRLDVLSLAEKHEIESRADLARLTERLRTMQHGETEALKMMGAEKRRADELAAQLETERAEFAEFRRRLLRALKPVGIESGLLDIELAAVRTQELAAAKAEAAQLRKIISDSVNALGNHSAASPDCTLDFMSHVPDEIRHAVKTLRDLAETLAKGISAYRWKSESVAAAWENDYGHTVPR